MIRIASGSRPASAAAARMTPTPSAIRDRSVRLEVTQPSAIRPARSSAGRARPPSRIGGPPGCTGFGATLLRRNLVELAAELAAAVRPELAEHRDVLGGARAAAGHRRAGGRELLRHPADAEAEVEPPGGQDVHGGRLLGQVGGGHERQVDDRDAEPDPRRGRRGVGQRGHGVEHAAGTPGPCRNPRGRAAAGSSTATRSRPARRARRSGPGSPGWPRHRIPVRQNRFSCSQAIVAVRAGSRCPGLSRRLRVLAGRGPDHRGPHRRMPGRSAGSGM